MQPFRRALTCVSSLLHFTMMAQYRSYTPETISYMEEYATQFHETKDLFLEFRISKRNQDKAYLLYKVVRHQKALIREQVPLSQRHRIRDDNCQEKNDQCMHLIHAICNFNFLKMHLISHFHDHIYQFNNIPIYSTEHEELAYKEQIKD